jgi:ribose 5-phosphate isomerase RpiB
VVCLGARVTGATVAVDALAAFLGATVVAAPEAQRHLRRIEKLTALDAEKAQALQGQGTS